MYSIKPKIMLTKKQWRGIVRFVSLQKLSLFVCSLLLVVSTIAVVPQVAAQSGEGRWGKVRSIYSADYNLASPRGMAFSPKANAFLLWDANDDVTGISLREDPVDMAGLNLPVADPLNVAFDASSNNLFALNTGNSELEKINANVGGRPNPSPGARSQFNLNAIGLQNARGIALNPENGRLFILNGNGAQIIAITPDSATGYDGGVADQGGRLKRLNLQNTVTGLRGLAFNPQDGHLYAFQPVDQTLYEFTESGDVVSTYDLSSLKLSNSQTLLFAPSGDNTDDPSNMNLFILDSGKTALSQVRPDQTELVRRGSAKDALLLPVQTASTGGQIVELALNEPLVELAVALQPTTLVQTIDVSNVAWGDPPNPSSPDPAGVAYWPAHNTLLISDSEVEENNKATGGPPPWFVGFNVFESSLTGTLLDTCDTLAYSVEPTGVAINPINNHIFISDDRTGGHIYEIDPGPDTEYCTTDDNVTTLNLFGLFGSNVDAEGVAYGDNKVFIAAGIDAEVHMFDLGANGVMVGGDDGAVTSFDTYGIGIHDLEGVEYNPEAGTLFLASTYGSDDYIAEVSVTGPVPGVLVLVQTYDLSYLGNNVRRSGLAYGPSSQNPAIKNLYLSSRGVDNNTDAYENDGLIWEINLGNNQTPKASTTTTVACATPVTYGGNSSCTATVTRASGSNTPTGSVSWATADSGNFSGSPCTLSGSGGTATCSVTYTPSAVGDGTHGITATYGGDANFNGSSGNQNVIVNKANPTLSVTNSPVVFDGFPHAATVTGSVPGIVSDIQTGGAATETAVGTYPVTADFVPTDTANYNSLNNASAGNFVIANLGSAPGVGIYDDTNANWTYTGSWVAYSGSASYYDHTTHYTTGLGDTASFIFNGRQFVLTYTQAPNRGDIDVFVDGNRVATVNATGVLQFQKFYISPVFSNGTHEVEFKHAGGGGAYIDVDAIQVLDASIAGTGVYDDTDANWSYSGSWTAYSGSASYYNNTVHYTSGPGNTASFAFSGTKFILTYTQAPNRGNLGVFVDGLKIATIKATGALQFKKTYTSPAFSSGTHIVQIKHLGGGTYVDVDAIEVLNTAAPGVGVYDDTHANWSYSGSWIAYSGGVPYANNTVHYTAGVGDTATFTFNGTQFVLTYTQAPNRGNIAVFVDGSQVTTVNATGALAFEQSYTSPVFSSGVHVVQFKHAGGGGAYADVDAIEVLNTAAPGTGVYDDTHANWSYSGSWAAYSGSAPYANNTVHYTAGVGDTATFTFNGTKFVLTYTQAPNRGNIGVFVDGLKIATINATGVLEFKKTYTSPTFSSGVHVVRFKHAGGGGAYIDVDVIQIP